MTNMKLTTFGKSILAPLEHAAGSPRFWIGYYALAYVPDRELDPISTAAENNRLTSTGDIIYNIWQGDMLNGYAQNNPEDTAAASLFGMTLYDKSIRTNYRYVYDPGIANDPSHPPRNQLVAWKSVSNGHGENTLERTGAYIYCGKTGTAADSSDAGLPIPAPLYYEGDPSADTISLNLGPHENTEVSADYRYYVGTRSGSGEEYGWKDSSETQKDGPIIEDNALLTSVSNFNKFHGTVSSEGYGVSSVSSCHNMSRATKYFPISHYTVVNDNGKKVAETKRTDQISPLATAIKFTIDLSPITADTGYTALNYEAGSAIDDQEQRQRDAYESKYISFKFNRIGIFAVPMSVHRYSTDSSTDECNLQKVQFEIDSAAEPQLFAIADVNDTIISDNPSENSDYNPDYVGGVAKFNLEFILHVDDTRDTDLETRTAVYYDLYERDATTWFKNQLLASASISEAVTDLSLEMNAIKQQIGHSEKTCCSQNLDLVQLTPSKPQEYPAPTKNIITIRGNDNAIYSLNDETVNMVTTPNGTDYIADIMDMLGNDVIPVIRFHIDGRSHDIYATLSETGYCGYMFSTNIPYLGQKYICIRYTDHGVATPGHIQVTVSSHNIDISDGVIHS